MKSTTNPCKHCNKELTEHLTKSEYCPKGNGLRYFPSYLKDKKIKKVLEK